MKTKDKNTIEEYNKCCNDFNYWFENYVKIKPKDKVNKHICYCKYLDCHINDKAIWCHLKQEKIPYEKCSYKCKNYEYKGNHFDNENVC